MPKYFRPAISAALIFGGVLARGQEALRQALEEDRNAKPPAEGFGEPQPEVYRFGPVNVSLDSSCSVRFDDNVFLTADQHSADAVLSAAVNARLAWAVTGQSEVDLNAGVSYARYLENPALSGLQVAPDSALTWNLPFNNGEGSLSFYDNFSYTRAVITEGALSNTGRFPRYDNTVGTRLTWLPARWELQAGYSHDNYFSDDPGLQYLNRSSEYFFARGGWRFAEATQAGLEASASLTAYDQPVQPDNTSISFGPYADWQITQSLHANLRAGSTVYFFDHGAGSPATGGQASLDSYYLGLDLNHQLAEFLWHSLQVRRDVQLGLNQGSAYIEQLSATYQVNWAVTTRGTLSGSVVYEHGNQPLPLAGGTVNEIYDRYGAGPTFAWQFTSKFSGSLAYFHWLRQSSLTGRGYTDNTLTLNLSYNF